MAQNYDPAEVYSELRTQALTLSSDQIVSDDGVLAILMESGYPRAVATLVAVADGTTSLYFSNGGGIIGAGSYEQVRSEAAALLKVASTHLSALSRVDAYPLPREGHTRFYVITEAGVFSAAAPEAELGADRHGLSPVFLQGHRLIAVIRAADEHRREAVGAE